MSKNLEELESLDYYLLVTNNDKAIEVIVIILEDFEKFKLGETD